MVHEDDNVQDSTAFKAALHEAVTTVTAEERQPAASIPLAVQEQAEQAALAQPKEDQQQALSSASQGKAVVRRAVARSIADSNLDNKWKFLLSDSTGDAQCLQKSSNCILAYQHSHINTYRFDFNMRQPQVEVKLVGVGSRMIAGLQDCNLTISGDAQAKACAGEHEVRQS